MTEQVFPQADVHVVDTNLFILFERTDELSLLERAVSEYDVEFVVPERVYEELTPEAIPYDRPPVEQAIEDGWLRVLEGIDYANPVVSATMDLVRRYISAADERAEHEIEQTDAALGGAAATLFVRGSADSVAIYTTDQAAFRGIERALAEHEYENRVLFVDPFDFLDVVRNRYRLSD